MLARDILACLGNLPECNRECYEFIVANKGPKNAAGNVRRRLKFGNIFRKDLLCMKIEKNGYREFDHRGTLIKLKNLLPWSFSVHFHLFSYR